MTGVIIDVRGKEVDFIPDENENVVLTARSYEKYNIGDEIEVFEENLLNFIRDDEIYL